MTQLDFSAAAKQLLANRSTDAKAERLAENLRPTSLDDALNIQAEMIAQNANAVAGWKCLNPPAEDKVVVGPIFADLVQTGAVCELFADKGDARIEPEIAFVLKQDLPARDEAYSIAEIDEAIGSCHMALELILSRFAEPEALEFPEILADGLVNQGLYLGPELDRTQAFAASEVKVSIAQGDNTQNFDGKHPNTQPASPIYWLVNFMSARGVSLKAGQAIITGSFCGVVHVAFDQPTTISYEGLGEYSVTFKAKG